MVRLMLRYLPVPVALACYVYIYAKMYLDTRRGMDAGELASIGSDFTTYAVAIIAPGLLVFIITAKRRIFKWAYLVVLLLMTEETARTHFFTDGRLGCELCFAEYLGLVVMTWPVFFVVSFVTLAGWVMAWWEKQRPVKNRGE